MLDIKTIVNGRIGTLSLIGDLDIASVDLFKSKIENIVDNVNSIVIDLAKLEFIDSTGVGSLIQVIRKLSEKNIDVKVINISSEVFEVLDLLGIPELLGEELFKRV